MKKILDLEKTQKTSTYLDTNILEITYNTNDLINIYNDYNNTHILKLDESSTVMKIYYTDASLDHIEFDITNLYNSINKQEKDKVLLTLTFKETKEENNNWIIEKLN